MVDKKEKERKNIAWSVLILSLALFTLVSTIMLCFYGMYGLSIINHSMKMEQLNTEKEIALINSNITEQNITINTNSDSNNKLLLSCYKGCMFSYKPETEIWLEDCLCKCEDIFK